FQGIACKLHDETPCRHSGRQRTGLCSDKWASVGCGCYFNNRDRSSKPDMDSCDFFEKNKFLAPRLLKPKEIHGLCQKGCHVGILPLGGTGAPPKGGTPTCELSTPHIGSGFVGHLPPPVDAIRGNAAVFTGLKRDRVRKEAVGLHCHASIAVIQRGNAA